MQKSDGMNYAPEASGITKMVVRPGEFCFSVIGLDHGHVFGMTNGLLEAGATLLAVYDDDEKKMDAFIKRYPQAAKGASEDAVLSDSSALIVSAIRPDRRVALGLAAMEKGKDVFVDKPGCLKADDVDAIRNMAEKTGRKYVVYFGERVHVEGSVYAERLIQEGKLGRIISMQILAPHRLNASTRPEWFWDTEKNGGILCDIGSHQLEQVLTYTGSESATITHAFVHNYGNPAHPGFQDYGEVTLRTSNGACCFCRVDWFTPDGLSAWGDGRVFIAGTKGSLEIRKYLNVAENRMGDNVFFVDSEGEHYINAHGKCGFPFFGAFILDCIHRTENAITQAHVLEAMRLIVEAQSLAQRSVCL